MAGTGIVQILIIASAALFVLGIMIARRGVAQGQLDAWNKAVNSNLILNGVTLMMLALSFAIGLLVAYTILVFMN